MTHNIFPAIPAGVLVQKAAPSVPPPGSFSLSTEEPTGQRINKMTSSTDNNKEQLYVLLEVWDVPDSLHCNYDVLPCWATTH